MKKSKKIIVTIIIILYVTLVLFFMCFMLYKWLFPDYTGWKEIKIEKIGSFYVPEEWVYTKEGTIVYFTDKPITEENYKIYLIGTESDRNKVYIGIEDIYPQYKKIAHENYKLLSNSSDYKEAIFEINGQKERKLHISFFGNDNELYLYAWDNLLDIETVKKIANSYGHGKTLENNDNLILNEIQ